jgi:hypothetical protein
VTYVVRGSAGAGALRVTYQTGRGGAEHEDQVAATGWSKRVTRQRGALAYISVQNGAAGGAVECTIIVNGRSFKRASSSGAAAIANCGGSVGPWRRLRQHPRPASRWLPQSVIGPVSCSAG